MRAGDLMSRAKSLSLPACILAFLLLAMAEVPALAYDEVASGLACVDCHAEAVPTVVTGPHGGYTTSTNKCQTCHTVHVAPAAGDNLLVADTIKGTCFTCHDGTAGLGVYGALTARSQVVEAEHGIDVTNVVPGGNPTTGGDASYTFLGEGGNMTCSDCHSPHASNVVNAFTGDRLRSNTSNISYVGNRLLRRRPNGAAVDIVEYGSDWCGACHKGRLAFGSGVNNHPVETVSVPSYFYYDRVARVTGFGVSTTELGTLGRNNRGYVMPWPRTAQQSGHFPICMQCHEDPRHVGDTSQGQLVAGEVFTVTTADGTTASDNPRFQTFPHQSTNAGFLLETEDDLCTNCHDPAVQLP